MAESSHRDQWILQQLFAKRHAGQGPATDINVRLLCCSSTLQRSVTSVYVDSVLTTQKKTSCHSQIGGTPSVSAHTASAFHSHPHSPPSLFSRAGYPEAATRAVRFPDRQILFRLLPTYIQTEDCTLFRPARHAHGRFKRGSRITVAMLAC